jgi:hypothetical protein
MTGLVCAICPACLTAYAKFFALFGVGFGITELAHLVLLLAAVSVSLGVSALRSWRTKRRWPMAVALGGTALVLAGHLAGDLQVLEWTGVLVLLGGAVAEQLRLRRIRVAGIHI